MSNLDIIRTWKDEEYRHGPSHVERTLLSDRTERLTELSDSTLSAVGGGLFKGTDFPPLHPPYFPHPPYNPMPPVPLPQL